jgi:hypothetical protein
MSASPIDFDRLDLAALRRRRGEKWQLYGPDVLPAWVAEMDFPLCAPVRRVLESALEIDDLGYPLDVQPDALPAAFVERLESRFGWRPDLRGIEVLTDVVQGIYLAIDQFSAPGEGVLVQTPVYAPVLSAVRELGRRLVESPLVAGDTRYEIDFDPLRHAIDPSTRVFLLCNPQNPTGRVFEQEYQCSSPDKYRVYHLRALPIDARGLLLEHSLVAERDHEEASKEAIEERYLGPEGTLLQCSHCRRVRAAAAVEAWDWVRQWVERPHPKTSHGICPSCVGYYWGRRASK